MEEPKRDKQVNTKFGEVEFVEIEHAAAMAGMPTATWCREHLLRAARGDLAPLHVQVSRAGFEDLQRVLNHQTKILLAVLDELLKHTHFGDPNSEHEDPKARELGKRRAARKMAELEKRLGLNGSGNHGA